MSNSEGQDRPADGRSAASIASPAQWRRFLLAAALTLLVLLAAIAGRIVSFDAYWLFRQRPPWLAETDGSNRLLDRQTRRAKVLQALTRSYTVAFLGSSTVYHGLDPDDVDERLRGAVFNAGISAVTAEELPLVAAVLASRSEVERVTVGLDYYMFSRADVPVRLNESLGTAIGRANALLGSALSRYALLDSSLDKVSGSGDPGSWTRAGFRVTPPLPPALTIENDAARRRTAAAYRPETLDALSRTLTILAGRRIDVYVSPVSDAQRQVLAEAGFLGDFERWRGDVAGVAAAHGAGFADLSDWGRAFPFDPRGGSTEHWLDNLHFTPLLGRMVLARFGLRSGDARPSTPGAARSR
jgi:hypothetical protein